MYVVKDISSTLAGDLEVSANGDLKLSNSFETIKSAVNFIVRTDKGEYAPDLRIGGDLGNGIGEKITKGTISSLEGTLRENLSKFILNPADFQVHIIPISQEELGVFVAVGGTYLDENGNTLATNATVLTYDFPYWEGSATPVAE